MKPLTALVLAMAFGALPGHAFAHVSLVMSSPQAGANLEAAPAEVRLTFDGELDPARSGFTVLDHRGQAVGRGQVDLGVADRNVLAGSIEVSVPGTYTVEWSVLGIDGHEISGAFSFGYASDANDTPDTALPAGTKGNLAVLAGIGLLALAALRAVRGSLVR
jgi:methionine-rich copper-binding protein CopC